MESVLKMASIKQFEDLQSWKESRKLCMLIRDFTRNDLFRKDFDLVRQIRRSSGSAMDNIAEGFERNGNREFINFLTIAKASVGETRSQLYRALDYGYISTESFNIGYEQCILTNKLISGFVSYLQTSELKGVKFKNR